MRSPAALYSSSTISCRFSRAWEATAEMPTVLFVRRLSSPAACAAHPSSCTASPRALLLILAFASVQSLLHLKTIMQECVPETAFNVYSSMCSALPAFCYLAVLCLQGLLCSKILRNIRFPYDLGNTKSS